MEFHNYFFDLHVISFSFVYSADVFYLQYQRLLEGMSDSLFKCKHKECFGKSKGKGKGLESPERGLR
jgi:hypothetical protein